ncbi:MAG: MFS transporter [Rhodospirillaceae bacterium]|nr:MFS transporter [Rhodospirillaceae bacterium]MBT5241910.1 MFS transporter [Rhodospirillaceae bacterium]MBT5567059.1 MFS transporter [Rhodospirillaceae bacterium]MBT6089548.1 MFS transporter [Rhodospirillaceae bacterium]MBT6960723.1 MFS transporter [Rhodospirillaceae bacterium]
MTDQAPTPEANRATSSLSIPFQLGFGAGQIGGSILANTPALILLFFMTDMLAIPPALAGLAVFLPKVWVIVFDPLMGRISDHTTSRWGRRRPFILAGALGCGAGFYFLFDVPAFDTVTARFIYMTVMFTVVSTAFSIFSVPYLAKAGELAPDYKGRTTIMAYRIAFQSIGILIGIGLIRYLVEWGGGGLEGYTFMGAVLAATCTITMLSPFFASRAVPTESVTAPLMPIREQVRTALDNKPYLTIAAAVTLYWVAASCVYAGLPYMFSYIVHGSAGLFFDMALYMTLASFVAIPAWTWLAGRIGKKPTYYISTFAYCATVLSWLTAAPDQDSMVVLRGIFVGLTNTGLLMTAVSMLPDTIEYDRIKTGLRREGIFSGFWMAIEKAGNAMGALVVGLVLSMMGFVESAGGAPVEQTESALNGILVAFAVVPVLLMLAGLVILKAYRLDEETLRTMRQDAAPPSA